MKGLRWRDTTLWCCSGSPCIWPCRGQSAWMEEKKSNIWPLAGGVPQSLTLSLRLLKFYMKLLGEVIHWFRVQCYHYADDTQLHSLQEMLMLCPSVWRLCRPGWGEINLDSILKRPSSYEYFSPLVSRAPIVNLGWSCIIPIKIVAQSGVIWDSDLLLEE